MVSWPIVRLIYLSYFVRCALTVFGFNRSVLCPLAVIVKSSSLSMPSHKAMIDPHIVRPASMSGPQFVAKRETIEGDASFGITDREDMRSKL